MSTFLRIAKFFHNLSLSLCFDPSFYLLWHTNTHTCSHSVNSTVYQGSYCCTELLQCLPSITSLINCKAAKYTTAAVVTAYHCWSAFALLDDTCVYELMCVLGG